MDHKEESKSLHSDHSSFEEQGTTSDEHTSNQQEEQAKANTPEEEAKADAAGENQDSREQAPEDDQSKEEPAAPGTGGTDYSDLPAGNANTADAEVNTEAENTPADQEQEQTSAKTEAEEANTVEQEEASEQPGNEGADPEKEEELPDYTTYSRKDLVKAFEALLEKQDSRKRREALETIKNVFFKKRNEELEKRKAQFQEEGGDPASFKAPEDEEEQRFIELYKSYKEQKKQREREIEHNKQRNQEASEQVIQDLKDLVNTQESLGKTFNDFKRLQERWREIGPVPYSKYKDLWVRYNHNIEKFYDYVKINKELKELDLKKNLEAKKELCENAEDLLLEEDVIQAYKSLQTLHDRWREIGPVPKEKKEEIWARFRAATKQINKKHQEYFEKQKEEREKNLEAKTLLCKKAEELAELEPDNHKEWEERTREIKKLQDIWRSIGFVPKKYNNKIYQRFRAANDAFFNKKRDFYADLRKEQQENLNLKRDLLEQAEKMQDSTDWKTATAFYKDIQEKWKQIGPVPKKHSDTVWKKFRAACNHFFDRKRAHFSEIDEKQEDNLKKKEELIQEVSQYQPTGNDEENLKQLKNFQERWSEIGFVPIQHKDRVQQEFSEAINKLYENLSVEDHKLVKLKYKTKIENLRNSPKPNDKLLNEREKIANKLKKVESDITLWENNIGFFTSDSDNAQAYIKEMEDKIHDAKKLADKLKTKLDIIDDATSE